MSDLDLDALEAQAKRCLPGWVEFEAEQALTLIAKARACQHFREMSENRLIALAEAEKQIAAASRAWHEIADLVEPHWKGAGAKEFGRWCLEEIVAQRREASRDSDDLAAAQARIAELEQIKADAYQAVGAIGHAFGLDENPEYIRLLDVLAYGKTKDGIPLLPFSATAEELAPNALAAAQARIATMEAWAIGAEEKAEELRLIIADADAELAAANKPLSEMTVDEIKAEIASREEWERAVAGEELGGGSPMETHYERLEELDAELARRAPSHWRDGFA